MSEQLKDKSIKITGSNLDEFKKLVRKAIFLSHSDETYFNSIPNETWLAIFSTNFNGNFNYAQRVILNQFRDIEKLDTARVDAQKLKIHNLDKAAKVIMDAINQNVPQILITDFDNDGSLAQSIFNEYRKIDVTGSANMHVEYAQTVNGNSNRGFTVDLVEKIIQHKGIDPNKKFIIITADNGINSLEEQKKIHAMFPEAVIVITDHHNPDPEMCIKENDKAVIFNPQYRRTEFFSKFNISGATTLGVLLKYILTKRYTPEQLLPFKNQFETMNKLFKVSNLLDYVHTDPADKPEKDYVSTKFLALQPLLNINNSISKIITGEINTAAIKAIELKIPQLNSDLLYEEAKNIHTQNHIAKVLLIIHQKYNDLNTEHKELLSSEDFGKYLLNEINKDENYSDYQPINSNFIEQLRPIIFGLTADDQNTPFLDELNKSMIQVFESIRISEGKMAKELRNGEVVTKKRLENSVISYADKDILSIFNRKFLNKVYNDENPGFSLTLDNIDKHKVSGSFRSLYDISDILKNSKRQLQDILEIKIETPGHEKAAGFIIKSLKPATRPITEDTIEKVNGFINKSISKLKQREVKSQKKYLLTDLQAITLIDKINIVIRGNISNFERITPLLKLTPDTVWTDSYTTKQYSMEDICREKKYGYITININFHGDTVIIPVELVRRIVANNYKDYINLNYMDGGVFMAEKVVLEKDAKNVIDLRNKNSKTDEIIKVFEKDFKDKNHIDLTRDQIKDNPFFKYSDYGKLNFDLFERMVIGVIDTNNVDLLSVFDVEANGFANAKLMNFGSMNYFINPNSGTIIAHHEFLARSFSTERGEEYLLTNEQLSELKDITLDEKDQLPLNVRKLLLKHKDNDFIFYLHPEAEKAAKNKKIKSLPFLAIKNSIFNEENNQITYNREVQATMLAYLVNDNDFKVPHEMTNLTGITQEVLVKYGTKTSVVDKEVSAFYKDKKVLLGAHNTPYDARILRANTKELYETLKNNRVYDSALFSRQEKLAYDEIKVGYFENVDGMPKIYFYNNQHSDFNLTKFITNNENGYYPDRTNNYLLEIENGYYYLVDKKEHKKIKLQFNKRALLEGEDALLNGNTSAIELGDYEKDSEQIIVENQTVDGQPLHVTALLRCLKTGPIPNTSVKYSVEQLSEQWMVHSLLLSDEEFDIKHVDLTQNKYASLHDKIDALTFFQDNYHFDNSSDVNWENFSIHYNNISQDNIGLWAKAEGTPEEKERAIELHRLIIEQFIAEFLDINKSIQQKFSDSWMYKKVLEIKDPSRIEVTNDLVDLVHYQTNIPKDKIRVIFDDAIRFKEKHNIDHILQHEGHINGPWEFDNKGDVAFEDKLTLALLAQRKYNSYSHDVKNAINTFNSYVVDARKAFDKAEELSLFLANDSYSYRQGILYGRDDRTELINNIQDKEASLLYNDAVDIVKFKMGEKVLTPNTAVYAVTKTAVSIDRAQIEADSEKLAFIIVNEQLKYAIDKSKLEANPRTNTINILTGNDALCLEYKEDLATRYKYIEFNKKDYQLTEFLDTVEKVLLGDEDISKLKKKKIDEIDRTGFTIIHKIVVNYVDNVNMYQDSMEMNTDSLLAVIDYLSELRIQCEDSTLEKAVLDENIYFGNDKENIREDNFLPSVKIDRRNPIKNLLEDHPKLRLINRFIEGKQQEALDIAEELNHTKLKI